MATPKAILENFAALLDASSAAAKSPVNTRRSTLAALMMAASPTGQNTRTAMIAIARWLGGMGGMGGRGGAIMGAFSVMGSSLSVELGSEHSHAHYRVPAAGSRLAMGLDILIGGSRRHST